MNVEHRLMGQFPNDDLLLLWNIGCPMDYLDEAGRKGEWERMAGVAMKLHGSLANPASISLLAEVTAAWTVSSYRHWAIATTSCSRRDSPQ